MKQEPTSPILIIFDSTPQVEDDADNAFWAMKKAREEAAPSGWEHITVRSGQAHPNPQQIKKPTVPYPPSPSLLQSGQSEGTNPFTAIFADDDKIVTVGPHVIDLGVFERLSDLLSVAELAEVFDLSRAEIVNALMELVEQT